jgi:hypothetical protein
MIAQLYPPSYSLKMGNPHLRFRLYYYCIYSFSYDRQFLHAINPLILYESNTKLID